LNHILGRKISITSRKSQTTRNNILGIKNIENAQLIFADTPGMHIKSPKIMNKVLNKSAEGLIDYSDIVLFVTQRLKLDDQDMSVLKKLKEANAKVICVVNKIDQIEDKQKLLPLMERLSELYDFLEIIPISALLDEGIEELQKIIIKYLPKGDHVYGEAMSSNNQKDMFMISELVREKIIRLLGDELPHDTFVQVEHFEDEENILKIHVVIFVVRDSQKQIVIGNKGATLKKIGKQARLDLEDYFEKKVFLKTWVKVKKNWNTDSDYIQSLGVGASYES
jgi:GTP-binding protein Era